MLTFEIFVPLADFAGASAAGASPPQAARRGGRAAAGAGRICLPAGMRQRGRARRDRVAGGPAL
jgi:hypothetical protein